MHIIEQNLTAKSPGKKSEDGIVVTDNFIAVIDGSTSKSNYRHSLLRSNGRYAMQLTARYIRHMPKETTCDEFLTGITKYVRKHYKKSIIPRLEQHPEDRITCSAVIFSRLCREVWMVGDCHCLVNKTYYDNPKPYEDVLADLRAQEARRLMEQGTTLEELRRNDMARAVIIPEMIKHMKEQNKAYAVIDGFHIPRQHVRIITLDFRPWELVLASDGYPKLFHTLAESEAWLQHQRDNDPLNIGEFKATKAFHPDNVSFDDRAYIRFSV